MPFDCLPNTDQDIERLKAVDDLKLARALIEKKQRWIRGALHSEPTFFRPYDKYCAVGALSAVKANCLAVRTLRQIIKDFTSIESFNDHSSHKVVLRAFDQAILQLT